VVNLPIFLPIGSRLRWRMASDTTGSTRVGALIQSILLVAHRFRVPRRRRLPHLRLLLHQRPQLRLVLHQRRQLHLPPTITPRPTPTARSNVIPRSRPTPAQRPTPWWVAHASRLTLKESTRKVRNGKDAIASTRDACATQERGHSRTETTSLD